MKPAKWILAGAVLMAIPSATLAQQPLTGTVVTINRLNGTIGIQQAQSGTVGAGSGGALDQEYKVPEGSLKNCTPATGLRFPSVKAAGRRRSQTSTASSFTSPQRVRFEMQSNPGEGTRLLQAVTLTRRYAPTSPNGRGEVQLRPCLSNPPAPAMAAPTSEPTPRRTARPARRHQGNPAATVAVPAR